MICAAGPVGVGVPLGSVLPLSIGGFCTPCQYWVEPAETSADCTSALAAGLPLWVGAQPGVTWCGGGGSGTLGTECWVGAGMVPTPLYLAVVFGAVVVVMVTVVGGSVVTVTSGVVSSVGSVVNGTVVSELVAASCCVLCG